MKRQIGTLSLVTLVALMIWVFAEAESLVRVDGRSIEVRFVTEEDSGWDVRVLSAQGWTGTVRLKLEGSNAAIGAFDGALREAVRLSPGVNPFVPLVAGERTIDLRSALRDQSALGARGVTIVGVEPATVQIVVDTLISVDARVVVEVPDRERVDAPAAEPASVTLRYPSRFAERFGTSPSVIARVDGAMLKGLAEGEPSLVKAVPVQVAGGLGQLLGVKLEPMRVDVTLTVLSKMDSVVLASVPVQIQMAPGELERYRVEALGEAGNGGEDGAGGGFVSDVTVHGPRDLIAGVAEGRIRIFAVVRLLPDELDAGITSKEVVFVAEPPQEGDLSFQAERTSVDLRIELRVMGEGGGGGGPATDSSDGG